MDKGAHFYKCDFQVHTPRDRAWTGQKYGVNTDAVAALTDEEKQQINDDRKLFAKQYLQKIRDAGLNAIAITDHHDVVFAKIIRKIAEEENKAFIEKGEFDKVVTVFPGIELTLSNPASQCILIFDADFTDASLSSVINFLGIQPSDEYDKFTVETERISQEIIKDLVHLHKKLDEAAYCRDKYIVLPNITKGGGDSILRDGFHEHYIKMPCVGGYTDKAISSESGYQNKINGGDINYGNKAVGVISTSDNRFEDGRLFGQFKTWIKWASPTAEAIRQACLAKESRISQIEPEIPQIFIKSIDVTTSKFLGTFDLNLNEQYNALIGGRGTGKSTIFEYLRWGLCDQTAIYSSQEELGIIEKRREELIQKTLAAVDGEVRITMEKNGILHIVKRNATNREILLKIGGGDFRLVKEDDVRKLLPIQSYSQKQLSDVGIKTEELKRFIEQPILARLSALKFQLNENSVKLRSSYTQLIRKRELEREIENFSLESESLNTQVESIRKGLKGVSDEDQITINKKSKYEKEQNVVDNTRSELKVFENKADELLKLLESYPEPLGDLNAFENKELIQEISTEIDAKFTEIKEHATALKIIFSDDGLKKLNELVATWSAKNEAFGTAYETAKSKSQSSQQQLIEIQKIENRITEINGIISNRRLLLKEMNEPQNDFNSARVTWKAYHEENIALLNEQAIKFTELSKNLIKAEVTKNINLQQFRAQFKNILEGTRIREERIEALLDYITKSDEPITAYVNVLDELRTLAEIKLSNDKTSKIPELPILTACGFTDEHKAKLSGKITAVNWIELATRELEFDPKFFYTTNNLLGDVIPFASASAGQQATALLTVLLNQSGIPLLIDQPEDDIDNRAIDQIIKNIWEAKKKRQLIFTSHNANLVVNGDAELVICCDYKDTTSQTRGVIKAQGAIDNLIVRNEITAVMEGGEKAFKLRKDKYGF